MSNYFIQRQIVIIDAKDANVEVIQPQLAVLMVDNPSNAGKRYLDVGSLCYRRRGKSGPHKVGCPVDLSSLDNARTPFVQALIEILRAKRSASSAIQVLQNITVVINWIDAQEQSYAFDDVSAVKQAYGDYTRYLLHRLSNSGIRGQRIKQSTACGYQAAARIAVMCATGMREPEARGVATYIPHKIAHANHVNLKLPNADVQARTFAALIYYIDEAHRLLIGGDALPLHFVSPNGESCYQYAMHTFSEKGKAANFSLSPMLIQSPEFPAWDKVKAHFGLVGDSVALEIERAIYDNTRKRLEKNDKDLRSDLRQWIGAQAVVAGMLVFIAATGCNLRVAQNLEVDTLEFIPSTQGKRFSGTKARAGGKTVNPEFGVRFVPVFKKYLELRRWVLNGSDSALVFPVISHEYRVSSVGNQQIARLKACFSKALPKTAWVTPTQWRKNVSYQYVKLSGGDMALTAEKLGNTEETVRQAYSRPALEDFAVEMASFFELMHQAAIDRTRSTERVPVRILDEKRLEASTGTGLCEKTPEAEPERAQGFTALAPAPACRDPETCLFCAHYAVHADEEDIRRLLSFRYLIHATKAKQPIDGGCRS
ncbi:hypothetical protein JR314_32445 [Pseudomonas aeruginosa]|uniref:hypothetical protein n=1 Tax=Pseudomonas aeruginosa TaxID=287 RepID=UPI0022EB5946|nr:hypothetical protein [Pseudomonas aeruginosa]MDA3374625.1 hypothetical protein [Pseudomonas aeruginosa]